MSNPIYISTTGTDGHTPVQDLESRGAFRHKSDIYLGEEGLSPSGVPRIIPKVNDLIFDVERGTIERVVDIHPSTFVPRLVPWNFRQITDEGSNEGLDALLGMSGCGETVRLLVNKSQAPYKCLVDQRYMISGLHARYAKVYRGAPSEGQAEIISMVFDPSGNFVGNDVALERVKGTDATNNAQVTPAPFRTTYDLKQGESVTLVVYGEQGNAVGTYRLVVHETGFLRGDSDATKYVTDISLESWLLVPHEPKTIEIPINLTVNSINAMGVVHYSDGTTKRLPANGGQFTLMGLNDFIASTPNTRQKVTLRYLLSNGEASYKTNAFNETFITEEYELRVGQSKMSYSVKLFCYPVWIDSVNGYRLEWFMMNLDRRTIYNVTNHIRYNTETNRTFDPLGYGIKQTLSVTLNLRDVSTAYHPHLHVQVVNVELLEQGTGDPTLWRTSDYGSERVYGINNLARYEFVNQNLKKIDLTMGALDYEEWLTRLFYNTNPLFDNQTETRAPEPNYFIIDIPGQPEIDVRTLDWDSVITTANTLQADSTIYIKFVLRTNDNDQLLGIAGVPLRQVSKL